MHRRAVSDAGELPSPRSSRAPSFSSERNSVAGSVTFQMPSSARPAPAYIAASVASQLVTDHHNAQLRDEHDDAHGDLPLLTNAVFSEQALSLLNGFLDNLLFAFLASARSPSLAAVRPAITEVLKPRLAREATATADDELQGLLGGDDEEFPEPLRPSSEQWDVEKVWKRTRLRIMVYTRLGELEDEDEERYVQQERGLSMDDADDDESGLVSWASAIFLTSVIEYIAEQTLFLSGQASYNRMAAKLKKAARKNEKNEHGELEQLERIIVEEHDVEKIALNSALGRLWRTWRKRVRSPITPLGMRNRASYSSLNMHSRQQSLDIIEKFGMDNEHVREVPEHEPREPTETEIAANIPLPISDNDVDEIEVPGLVFSPEDDEEDTSGADTPIAPKQTRPTSVIMLTPADMWRKKRANGRGRPLSMPPPASLPFTIPPRADPVESTDTEHEVFATPMERGPSDDESFIMDEEQEGMHGAHQDEEAEASADMVAFAASTGMGFGMHTAGNRVFLDGNTASTPTETEYASNGEVLPAKRMSIEKPGPPDVVRTRSVRSQQSSPPLTPEPRTFLDDAHTDDDMSPHRNAGAESTPKATVPARSLEKAIDEHSTVPDQRQQPDYQGFVELSPRHATESGKEPVRETQISALPQYPGQQINVSKDKAPMRREITPPKGRGPALASLQEVDVEPSSPKRASPKKTTPELLQRTSSNNSAASKNYGTIRARESPVAERPVPGKWPSNESPPVSRTIGSDGKYVEKSTLKRVSSTSTGKSASTSILNMGRDSDGSLSRPRGLSGRMSEEDRVREFDSLVKSEDTVKFTLTPQSMRDMDEPTLFRTVEAPRPAAGPTSVTVYPRVSADKDNQFGSPPRNNARSVKSPRSQSVNSFGPKPLAREPRIQPESMRDFADFIRSTGPSPGAERPVQPFVKVPTAASPSASATPVGGLGRAISTRQVSSHSTHSKSSSLVEGPSARPRIHMQPRSPAGQRSGNDDLIDFIRQGPPEADGHPRINRNIAPFRTTVDSDQFDRMLENNSNIDSTYSSQLSSASRQSANSRTGLLPPANTSQPAYGTTPQKLNGNQFSGPDESGPQVTRTRRRIKDPYAIPDSDEEEEDDEDDDLLTALPPSTRRKEESLADFLNSAEPPRNNNPQPLMLSEATLAAAKARAANTSAYGNNSNNSLPGSSTSSGTTTRNGSTRGPSQQSYTPSGAPVRGFQGRGAPTVRDPQVRTKTSTSDLADFLRSSGPPEPVKARTPEPEVKKRSGARFWRKRSEVA